MTTQTNSQIPNFSLAGQTALVTGAARGLGRSIAIALAAAGADVALGLRDKNSAKDLIAEIEALGRHAIPLQMDVSKLDQINSTIDATAAQFADALRTAFTEPGPHLIDAVVPSIMG